MTVEFAVFATVVVVIGMCFIHTYWIWLGKDAQNLPDRLRPGFFRFWFIITPRFLLGLPTGMEKYTFKGK